MGFESSAFRLLLDLEKERDAARRGHRVECGWTFTALRFESSALRWCSVEWMVTPGGPAAGC